MASTVRTLGLPLLIGAILVISTFTFSWRSRPHAFYLDVTKQLPNRRSLSQLLTKPSNLSRELGSLPRAVQAVPYNPFDYFDFYQFDLANTEEDIHKDYVDTTAANLKRIVSNSIVETQQMLSTTLIILDKELDKPTPDNPSFLRYFHPGDLQLIINIITRILATTGLAGYENLRKCLDIPKLEIYYEEPDFLEDDECHGDLPAYYNKYILADGREFPFITLCPFWFLKYRNFLRGDYLASVAGRSADLSCSNRWDNPLWTSTAVILHEFFHNHFAYRSLPAQQVVDLWLEISGQHIIAYGAYYAMIVKNSGAGIDPTIKRLNQPPTLNADNFVWTVIEIYYKETYQLPDWQNPPDPKFAAPCSPLRG